MNIKLLLDGRDTLKTSMIFSVFIENCWDPN